MKKRAMILGVSAFERRYGNLYRSLYRGDEPFKASFCNRSWRFVLKTNSFEWNSDEYDLICEAARTVGDAEMIWTNLQFVPPRSTSCVLPLNYAAYVEAMRDEQLRWLHAGRKAVFGDSGSWAALVDEATYFAGGFAIFGGTAPFIDKLARSSGGLEKMRQEFIAYLDDPTTNVPANLRRRLLEEVAWF